MIWSHGSLYQWCWPRSFCDPVFLPPVYLAVLMAAICALASYELLRATGVAHHNGLYGFTAAAAAAIPWGSGWGGGPGGRDRRCAPGGHTVLHRHPAVR